MNSEVILKQFGGLGTWSRAGQRAPHKPLLVLYALGRWQRGDIDDIPYAEVDQDLSVLLKEFGPPRKSLHTEYPFWRLQNDGVLTVRADDPMATRASNTDPRKSQLLAKHARGGFTDEISSTAQ